MAGRFLSPPFTRIGQLHHSSTRLFSSTLDGGSCQLTSLSPSLSAASAAERQLWLTSLMPAIMIPAPLPRPLPTISLLPALSPTRRGFSRIPILHRTSLQRPWESSSDNALKRLSLTAVCSLAFSQHQSADQSTLVAPQKESPRHLISGRQNFPQKSS